MGFESLTGHQIMYSKDYFKVRKLINPFFKGDEINAHLWMELDNPLLGGVSPNKMIEMGESDKLIKFIKQQLDLDG